MGLPGEAAAPLTSERQTSTSSTSTFTTTETVTDTITATLVAGEIYRVEHTAIWSSSVANDIVAVRLREDNVTGTAMNGVDLPITATGRYFGSYIRAFYTAAASGSKTFVATGQRASGSGNITRAASSANPSVISVTQEL